MKPVHLIKLISSFALLIAFNKSYIQCEDDEDTSKSSSYSILGGLIGGSQTGLQTKRNHTIYWGRNKPSYNLLYNEIILMPGKFGKKVHSDIYFPENSEEISTGKRITFIIAVDRNGSGNGGYARIISGGVGYKSVHLRFESTRSVGLNFLLEIYGYK